MTPQVRLDNLPEVTSAFTPRSTDRLALGAALVAHVLVWMLGARPVALDPDVMNLAYGMQRFDITHFNPHAPGYLVYVWTLQAVHLITAGGESLADRFATVQLVALLFGLGAIALVYATARRLKLSMGAGWASLVMALHPILVFHSVDAQTHTSEAFASSLLLFGALGYRQHPGWQRAIGLGLIIALGSALRPSFVIFGVPVIIWTVGFARFGDLIVAGAASVVGAFGWIVPTVYLSGGWETWRSATRGLVHQGFVLTSSPFSDSAVGALVWANQLSLALWAFEAVLPLLVAYGVAHAIGQRMPRPMPPDARWLRGVLWTGGTCAVLYYSATFISEPGYLAALLPPVALGVGMLSGERLGARPAVFAVLALLLCWAIPQLPRVLKVPSVAEWQRRTELATAYAEHLESALPTEGRYLAIIGHPDITVGRQLPMLNPRVDALLVHDGRRAWIGRTSLTYVTEDDTTPVPEAFGPPGAGTSIATSRSYDGVYFDGSLAPHFQAQLAGVSACPTELATDVTQTAVLAARCIQQETIVIDGLALRFGVAGAPER